MPIESPQLDDLRFDRVVAELQRRIPVYTPEWTDWNDSDPGITMLHLFAYLAEQVGYRLNRVPEKTHVELLKLLGVRLRPARAARTRLAFLLSDPALASGFRLAAGARAKAKAGDPPPSFETEQDVDIVPAEPVVMITTKNPLLWDVRALDGGGREAAPAGTPDVPGDDTEWATVAWDGRTPRLKDMPLDPLRLFRHAGQRHLWVGLDFNPARDAGFLGVRVTLTVQLDDDESPSLTTTTTCPPMSAGEPAPPRVDWLHYYDADAGDMRPVPGRVDDGTGRLSHSGTLRFEVPFTMGPIPAARFANLRDATGVSPLDACLDFGAGVRDTIGPIANPLGADYRNAVTAGLARVQALAGGARPALPHPLDPRHRDPSRVRGWLRITLPAPVAPADSPRVRIVVFNTAPAINATTVLGELVGASTGRPGQRFRLAHGNVLDGSLLLDVQEGEGESPRPWKARETLDDAGPDDSAYVLDPEAGDIAFGDGERGRIPPLVPRAGFVIATRYRYGGGKGGEVLTGAVATLETSAPGLASVTNFVPARGGRDAETLDDAKRRARRELSTRTRAVTATDFAFIAKETQGVRVARAVVVPLRQPLPSPGAGLDEGVAAGVVSVVVVPDVAGPEPIPTPSFLRAVCEQLDAYRLVTTEVHVAPPQYARLGNVVALVRAQPGYTRAGLQELAVARLARYLHPLTGGEDGAGFPFGGQVHVADLIAQLLRVEGVNRVESLSAEFTRTRTGASPRQGRLVLCPSLSGDVEALQLAPEECVSFDATRFTLGTST